MLPCGRGFAKHGDGFLQSRQTLPTAAREPGDAQRHTESPPAAELPDVSKLGFRQFASAARVAKGQQSLRGA
jgi:hypothetical protein